MRSNTNDSYLRKLQQSIRLIILLVTMLFSLSVTSQEQKSIHGTVTNEDDAVMAGASIMVQGTTIGTLTDAGGFYSINVPLNSNILVVSFSGYQNQFVNIDGRTTINVKLYKEKIDLDEVVVTGYTSQRRGDIIGAISIVSAKTLQEIPSGSASRALQGLAPGVNVVSAGTPGAPSRITIRGISSFGNSEPLVLIDGIIGDLSTIDPNSIESMQILKDAGAAAIYGVRGSNGVIVVTTKKGKEGKFSITYDGFAGVQQPLTRSNPLNLLNTSEWIQMYNTLNPSTSPFLDGIPDYLYRGPGVSGVAMEGDPAVDPAKYNLNQYNPERDYIIQKVNKEGTDWYHALFKPALHTNHNFTASGGTEKAAYLFSLGYLNQQGVVIKTYDKRYSTRINTQLNLKKNIRIGENLYLFYEEPAAFSNNQDFGYMTGLYQVPPLIPVRDIAGNLGGTFGGPSDLGSRWSPVAYQESSYNNRFRRWNVSGNIFAEIDFLKRFSLRTSFGGTIQNNFNQTFVPSVYANILSHGSRNSYNEMANFSLNTVWSNTLVYDNTFGKSDLNVLIGSEAIRNNGRTINGSSQNYFLTDFNYLLLQNGPVGLTSSSAAYENTLFSLFGKLDFKYDKRYLFAVTLRRDGSSVFGNERRYGVFPSVSLGWLLSNEKFMEDLPWLDELKIRASYGILGSQNNVNPSNAFSLFSGRVGAGYYGFSGQSNLNQGFYASSIGNSKTGWEKDIVTNAGVDIAILQKFSFTLDVYKKFIEGLLFPQPLPATVGNASRPSINIGDLQNVGLDISATYYGGTADKKLNYSLTANWGRYRNTIKSLPEPGYYDTEGQQQLGNMVRNQEGHPISSFFGYEVIGLFDSDEDISNSPTQADAKPGRFKYKDIDKDGKITPSDRTFLGSANPDFTYGFNGKFNYRGIGLSAFFYGSHGNKVTNVILVNSDFYAPYLSNKSKNILNAWTPENKNTGVPILETSSNFSTNGTMNSYFVEDGSFLKLRSLVLDYSFKPKVIENLGVGFTSLKVYLQATNLFTITKYSGLDPELTGRVAAWGFDYGNYPNNIKNFIFGVNIAF